MNDILEMCTRGNRNAMMNVIFEEFYGYFRL